MRFLACSQTKKKKRKVTVREAKKILFEDEASKLIDADELAAEGIHRAEQMGMILLTKLIKSLVKKAAEMHKFRVKVSKETFFQSWRGRKFLPNMVQSTRSTFYSSQQGLSICLNQAI